MKPAPQDPKFTRRSDTLDRHFYGFAPPFWGELFEDDHEDFRIRVYGFDTTEVSGLFSRNIDIPPIGSVFGFVQLGSIAVKTSDGAPRRQVNAGEFFVCDDGARISMMSQARFIAIQQVGYLGIGLIGGPIEKGGRLRYIDGCSDTMVIGPLLKGGPCLNHLHVPPGIDQTFHTHPSIRVGCVAYGSGQVRTPATAWPVDESGAFDLTAEDGSPVELTTTELTPGMVWIIPRYGIHGFRTRDEALGVMPYHPDTEQGPDHEHHPMKSRTLVDGVEVDNTGARNEAVVVDGYFPVPGAADVAAAMEALKPGDAFHIRRPT